MLLSLNVNSSGTAAVCTSYSTHWQQASVSFLPNCTLRSHSDEVLKTVILLCIISKQRELIDTRKTSREHHNRPESATVSLTKHTSSSFYINHVNWCAGNSSFKRIKRSLWNLLRLVIVTTAQLLHQHISYQSSNSLTPTSISTSLTRVPTAWLLHQHISYQSSNSLTPTSAHPLPAFQQPDTYIRTSLTSIPTAWHLHQNIPYQHSNSLTPTSAHPLPAFQQPDTYIRTSLTSIPTAWHLHQHIPYQHSNSLTPTSEHPLPAFQQPDTYISTFLTSIPTAWHLHQHISYQHSKEPWVDPPDFLPWRPALTWRRQSPRLYGTQFLCDDSHAERSAKTGNTKMWSIIITGTVNVYHGTEDWKHDGVLTFV